MSGEGPSAPATKTTYCLAEVVEALGNSNWPSPVIIIPPHYIETKADGQYVKYLRPPWTDNIKGLIEDFVVRHPNSTAPPDWDDIKVNFKGLATSYEEAQLKALEQGRKSVSAFRRKQAALAKATSKANNVSNKKAKLVQEYPPTVTSISSFIQRTIIPKAVSTPKVTAQNIPCTVTSGALQDGAQRISFSTTSQIQDSSVSNDKLKEAIMAVPGMSELLEEDELVTSDQIKDAIMNVPGLDQMLPIVDVLSGNSNVEVNIHQDESQASINLTGSTVDHDYSSTENLNENQDPYLVSGQELLANIVSHGEEVLGTSITKEQSIDSAISSGSSSAALLNNYDDDDCFVTKKDLREFKNDLLTGVGNIFYKVLSGYFDKKYGETFTSMQDDLSAVRVGVMERIPLAELNNVITLGDLKVEFNLTLPMTTQAHLDLFNNLLINNHRSFYTKVKEHIIATTSSKLEVIVSLRVVIKKFMGKESIALYTSSRSSKTSQKSIFKETRFYACLLDSFMQMYNKLDKKTQQIAVKVTDADFATNIGLIFNSARTWNSTPPQADNVEG